MKKRKPYIIIATSVLSLNLYGCGTIAETLKEECEKKGEFFTYLEDSAECIEMTSNPPLPVGFLKEQCEKKGEDFTYNEETGQCDELMTNPLPFIEEDAK